MRKAGFIFASLFAFLCLFGLLFPAVTDMTVALSGVCTSATDLLPPVSMLLILVAAVVYGTGQIMGAETRARANVWATTCMTGALMGMLIVTVSPPILGAMYGGDVTCTFHITCPPPGHPSAVCSVYVMPSGSQVCNCDLAGCGMPASVTCCSNLPDPGGPWAIRCNGACCTRWGGSCGSGYPAC